MLQQRYSSEPEDKAGFTEKNDKVYTRIAALYDFFVEFCPVWRNWLKSVLPEIGGPRVLDVSFGTGWLLTQYADRYETHGVEYNKDLFSVAQNNLKRSQFSAKLLIGSVEDLPYADGYFDNVVVTMAFTGFPDGHRALSELKRVLKRDGKLIMVDVNYPANNNCLGTFMTRLWQAAGDIIRNMGELFEDHGFLQFSDQEIGGFGSVHLYVATKQ